jgi:hypothetical protein
MHLSPVFLATSTAALPTILIERAVSGLSVPVDFSFGVRVPTSLTSTSPPGLVASGYQFSFPRATKSGSLISWLGNYKNGKAYNTQLTFLNPSAPRNITTSSTSNSQEGGDSFTNATALADGQNARVVTTTFSSGDAAAAAAGALDGTTSTSTSSSGSSNSTAVAIANSLGEVIILTSANTAEALNSQPIINAKGAEAASSCAADSGPAAEAEAEQINGVLIPIGQSPDGTKMYWLYSSAYAACAAGVDAPNQGGSSSSGSQSTLTGVNSMATCNGITSTQQDMSTTFKVTVKGTYTLSRGFSGAVGGQRIAQSTSQC